MSRTKQSPPVVVPIDSSQRWLTLADAATYLSVSVTTIRSLIHKGEIPAARLGTACAGYRVDRFDLDRWLEKRKGRVAPYRVGTHPWVKRSKPWEHRADRQRAKRGA